MNIETAFSAIPLPARQAKPRDRGITMMIDWGLPVGLQLVGRPRGEAELLRFAARLEEIVALSPLAPIDPRPGA